MSRSAGLHTKGTRLWSHIRALVHAQRDTLRQAYPLSDCVTIKMCKDPFPWMATGAATCAHVAMVCRRGSEYRLFRDVLSEF